MWLCRLPMKLAPVSVAAGAGAACLLIADALPPPAVFTVMALPSEVRVTVPLLAVV
jgi:hypothetical protein